MRRRLVQFEGVVLHGDVQLGEELRYIPRGCSPKTPLEALELALYYEEMRYYFSAWEYYEKASQMSDHPFYQEVFENFKTRKDNYFGYGK